MKQSENESLFHVFFPVFSHSLVRFSKKWRFGFELINQPSLLDWHKTGAAIITRNENDLDCRHQTLPGEILCFYVVVTVSCSQHYICSHGRRCWFWGLLLCSLYAFHVRVGFNVHQFWDNLNTAELQRRSLSVFCVFSWVQPTRRLLPLQNKHEAFRFSDFKTSYFHGNFATCGSSVAESTENISLLICSQINPLPEGESFLQRCFGVRPSRASRHQQADSGEMFSRSLGARPHQ